MDYIIGFLDDDYEHERNYSRNLKKCNIAMKPMSEIDDVSNISLVIDYILDNEINCLLVDYDLLQLKSKIYGTYVIKDINNFLPSFPCFLITNYVTNGEKEKLVPSVFIEDKKIFEEDAQSEKFKNFADKIKNSIDCFQQRLNLSLNEYKILFEKVNNKTISADEEQNFYNLYKILKAYGFVDEIPEYLLYKETDKNLKEMLNLLNKIDEKLN